jgi:hypothetical protein
MKYDYGICIMEELYRAGTIVRVSKELSKYKLDLVGVQEVRWEGGGTEPEGEYTFFYGRGIENLELGTGFLCIRESYQQLRREFVGENAYKFLAGKPEGKKPLRRPRHWWVGSIKMDLL